MSEQSPKHPNPAVPDELTLDKQSTSDENQGILMSTDTTSEQDLPNAVPESDIDAPTPKRPLMRPVNRPNPPMPPTAPPPAASPVRPTASATSPTKPEVVAVVKSVPDVLPTPEVPAEVAASGRQRPIPPPSEPKQYRAIGLVRGRYTASEEQFTRGEMTTSDGATVEAVLLGRVMSLVKNHLDLAEEHLWVVYPRTRELEQDLHLQIVGVWEPEKLQKSEDEDGSADAGVDAASTAEDGPEAAEDGPEAPATTISETDAEKPAVADDCSPGYDDDYFSIRGEVVFYAPENKKVVVKIQQAPRKANDKAKAFKLQLEGDLNTEKAVGYFWDFQVNRTDKTLAIMESTSIGLVPPKKRPPGGFSKGPRRPGASGGRRFGPPREGGSRVGPPRAAGGAAGAPVRREAGAAGAPKPVKRTTPKPEE
jgi:hypothetical protein